MNTLAFALFGLVFALCSFAAAVLLAMEWLGPGPAISLAVPVTAGAGLYTWLLFRMVRGP